MIEKTEAFQNKLASECIFCVTTDLDWASETAIGETFRFFREMDIPLTVFATHDSAVVKAAAGANEIMLGWHPNFMPGSSQGNSYAEIIAFLDNLYPHARGFRSHRYYDVNDILELLYDYGIFWDSNVCTFMQNIPPFLHRSGMIRFPIFWEDGAHLLNQCDFNAKSYLERFLSPGLRVINIHPMHLMINSPDFKYMRNIKNSVSREEWNAMDWETINKLKHNGEGIATFIADIITAIKIRDIKCMYLDDLYEEIITE